MDTHELLSEGCGMNAKQRQSLNEALVCAWGNTPEGTAVIVIKDQGGEVLTKTRSAPWMLGGHSAVIMLEGITGAYALDRVRRAIGSEA